MKVIINPKSSIIFFFHMICFICCIQVPVLANGLTGTINGTVLYDDGTPFVGDVVIRSKTQKDSIVNKIAPDGKFKVNVPIGECELSIRNINEMNTTEEKQNIIVATDEIKQVNITLKRKGGIVLSLITPDQHVVKEDKIKVVGKYTLNDGNQNYCQKQYFSSDGRIWFYDVPTDIKSFDVKVNRGMDGGYYKGVIVTSEHWEFTGINLKRTLTMIVPPINSVAIRICDKQGHPLPSITLASAVFTIPEQAEQPSFPIVIENPVTDNEGRLVLGLLGECKNYTLNVCSADSTGGMYNFSVNAKGEADPPDYRLSMVTRDVKQRIFTNSKVPAANKAMSLSYSWLGQMFLRKAITDANGDVIWSAIPPVPAMVWGANISVTELPPDVINIQTPLSAPKDCPIENYSFGFTFKGAYYECGGIDGYIIRGIASRGIYPFDPPFTVHDTLIDKQQSSIVEVEGNCRVGAPVQILLWSHKAPNRYALLTDFFLPRGGGKMEIPSIDPFTIRIQMQNPKGEPIQAMNPFYVIPDGDSSIVLDGNYLPGPKALGNGIFELYLPWYGNYRLCIDRYLPKGSVPSALHFVAKSQTKPIKVTMPEPLALVPPGTQVFCLPLSSPERPDILTAPSGAAKVPIYADKKELLAYWYRVTPDRLNFWQVTDTQQTTHELSLRTHTLTTQWEDDGINDNVLLMPLLPTPDDKPVMSLREHTDPQLFSTLLKNEEPKRLHLWPGEYLIYRQRDMMPIKSFILKDDIKTNDSIKVRLPSYSRDKILEKMRIRTLKLSLPKKINYGFIQDNMIITDNTGAYRKHINKIYKDGDEIFCSFELPMTVKSVTVQIIGKGIMRGIDVSDVNNDKIYISAWQPDIPCSGVITQADGTPYTKGIVVYTSTGIRTSITTDAQGKFTVSGVLPDILVFEIAQEPFVTWQVNIPEKGKTDISLMIPVKPININISTSTFNTWSTTQVDSGPISFIWWCPDNGQVSYLKGVEQHTTNCLYLADVAVGDGWIWKIIDEKHGKFCTQRFTVHASDDDSHYERFPPFNTIFSNNDSEGPSLGIILPYLPNAIKPGSIALTGLKNRTGAGVFISDAQWVVNPMLKCISTTLHGIPPGEYNLKIITEKKIIDEVVTVTPTGGYFRLDK